MGIGQPGLAGVRAVTGEQVGRLRWVAIEALDAATLERGARVLVREGSNEWFGEVVVPPGQVLELPPLADLPRILRLTSDSDGWPTLPDRSGRALLDSLDLPAELLEPSAS